MQIRDAYRNTFKRYKYSSACVSNCGATGQAARAFSDASLSRTPTLGDTSSAPAWFNVLGALVQDVLPAIRLLMHAPINSEIHCRTFLLTGSLLRSAQVATGTPHVLKNGIIAAM